MLEDNTPVVRFVFGPARRSLFCHLLSSFVSSGMQLEPFFLAENKARNHASLSVSSAPLLYSNIGFCVQLRDRFYHDFNEDNAVSRLSISLLANFADTLKM